MASFNSDRSKNTSAQSTATAEASNLGTVDIEIQGRSLSVKSDRDPEFVRSIAEHVDNTLGELKQAAPGASTDKLLMMASLTIAEELFEARRDADNLRDEVRDRTQTIQQLIDQVEQQV